MGFGLLVPAFLAGLAALAIPVVLHLRHRDKDRPQRFPSLMFLQQLPIRIAQRRRITDLPLLLLRALALALLVLAFARPVFSRTAATERANRARAVVLLLDRSQSMGHTDVWPAAMDSARHVITSLDGNDRVAVVFFDDEAEIAQPFTVDKTAALAALGKAAPTSRGTRYASALRAARQLIVAANDVKGEIVIVTDLQRSGVSGVAGLDLPEGMSVRTISVGPVSKANTAVGSVEVHHIVEPTRTMLSVQARVISRELKAPRKVKATLILNGRPSGTREVTIPVTGDVPVAFDPVLLPAGRVRGAIALDHDALAADDSFHFAFKADDAVRVLLVAPEDAAGDETLFFERALGVGHSPLVHIQRVIPGRLDERELEGAALVVLWDTPVPTLPALAQWVRRGGGLVVVPGRRSEGRVASPLLPATIGSAVDRLNDRGGSLGDVRMDHPLFAAFRATPAALNAARFLRYPRLTAAPGSDVIARFDDGLPAVVERKEGMGRVMMIVASLDSRSGDFPLQPAYLPFLQRLVLYGAGRDVTTLWRATGQSWLLPGSLKEPAVLTPRGAILRPARDSVGSTVALRESGVYALYEGRVQGEPAGLLAVNAPSSESDLTPLDVRELLLGVKQSAASADASVDVPTQAEVEGRQRLWRILLAIVAILLMAETFVANRGWRGTATRLTVEPSEGSAS
ncbi:MAG: putative rane protein [Gemmatimonadetes bacterium]|nr:putative rane protein [Gemmatimonadota bacterium]